MNRPRIAAIVSGVAASTAAFVVTSRYHLAGTLAGAAVVPIIYILVSHGAMQGADAAGRWLRARQGRAGSGVEGEEPAIQAAPPADEAGEKPPAGGPAAAGRAWRQWWLAGLVCVAMAVSVYAIVTSNGTTVVRQTVIQKVTESTEAKATEAKMGGRSAATATTEAGAGTTATTQPATTSSTRPGTDEPAATSTTLPADTTTTTVDTGGDTGAGAGGGTEPSITDTTAVGSTSAP